MHKYLGVDMISSSHLLKINLELKNIYDNIVIITNNTHSLKGNVSVFSVNQTSKILLLKNWNYHVTKKSIKDYYNYKTKQCFLKVLKGLKSEGNS